MKGMLPDLVKNYEGWVKERSDESGLFWQIDNNDGMEYTVSGELIAGKPSGSVPAVRPTINSYQYGDAVALSKIATLAGDHPQSRHFANESTRLRMLVLDRLWDDKARFFVSRAQGNDGGLVAVREQVGYVPWYFHLPPSGAGYAEAWKQLVDDEGFWAPYGPTTCEQRHKGFKVRYQGHECQWNGPSWPFATTQTLKGLANALRNDPEMPLGRKDYFNLFKTYTRSHRLKRSDGEVVPWIDENLNPETGDWISRTMLQERKQAPRERGKDYNHSGYCDLVISGLVGLIPQADGTVVVDPLVPENWDYFCLDRVRYHDRELAVIWDREGKRYGKGAGLQVLVDGQVFGRSDELCKLMVALDPLASLNEQGGDAAQFITRLEDGEKVKVVTMGTSLTGGRWRWPDVMMEWLEKEFPGQVTLRNLGRGASASSHPPGHGGLDVLPLVVKENADVVFIEYGINDSYSPYGITVDESVANLRQMVADLRKANPEVEIILQTMNAVANVPDSHIYQSDTRRGIGRYYKAHVDLARELDLRVVRHYPRWRKLLHEDPIRFVHLVPDGVHPQLDGLRTVMLPGLKQALEGQESKE